MQAIIRNLEGIEWNKHMIGNESLESCLITGEIQLNDEVNVKNNRDSYLDLDENEYCITFNKNFENGAGFYHEEIFTVDECKKIFGESFNYIKDDTDSYIQSFNDRHSKYSDMYNKPMLKGNKKIESHYIDDYNNCVVCNNLKCKRNEDQVSSIQYYCEKIDCISAGTVSTELLLCILEEQALDVEKHVLNMLNEDNSCAAHGQH